ncbi:DNA topoisomerase 1, partial [Haematococcus lacustris]
MLYEEVVNGQSVKEVLGKKHKIQALDKCDFTPIFDYLMAEREKKKAMTKEVGNFRVEPPGLFRGRGEHPKMGMIKKRIYPRDITINIGEGEPLPEHPYPGQQWKEVKHDHSVTWLAYWKDTISNKDFKYVFLGATSTFKADSDLAKYEKARALKEIIHEVRRNYESDLGSKEDQKRQ